MILAVVRLELDVGLYQAVAFKLVKRLDLEVGDDILHPAQRQH